MGRAWVLRSTLLYSVPMRLLGKVADKAKTPHRYGVGYPRQTTGSRTLTVPKNLTMESCPVRDTMI